MMPLKLAGYSILFFLCVCSCEKVNSDEEIEETEIKVIFEESFEDFANPERGFYKYSATSASNYSALNETQLKAYRGLTSSSGSAYKSYNTLVFRYFILDEFRGTEIDADVLTLINEDFNIARNAGVKLIPRFCYTTDAIGGDCPEDFICPPYNDAPKNIVLQHIQQLAPIINNNVDVILCVQMGFIGTWGENYYTDYFGDASSNGGVFKLLNDNWNDRIDVLQTMLDLFSKELMIQVRYPQMKQRTVYGIDAPTTVSPLLESEAFTGTDKARIGHHNDCLFASPDDFGTYEDYGNSSSVRRTDLTNLKPYFAEDSKYVLVGGETCFDGYSPQNNCEPEGMADSDLRKLHYTYLNADYNNQVNNDWVDGGCMDSILLHLGYRYVLQEALFKKELTSAGNFDFTLKLKNVGYATITKKRPVILVLKNADTGIEFSYTIDTDIRKWVDNVDLDLSIKLSDEMVAGEYDCFLHFPDGYESLKDRVEYAIQLANVNIWDEDSGYNNLEFTIKVP